MEKKQYRSVIRLLFLEGKSSSEIKGRLDAVYCDFSDSIVSVKTRFNVRHTGLNCDENPPPFGKGKNVLLPRQRTGSHLRCSILLRPTAPSTVFSRFGNARFPFVAKI